MTSAEVAQRLGVGTSSVKRWADQGLLRCVKTPGSHRRFAEDEVERFRRDVIGLERDAMLHEVDGWVHRLLDGSNQIEVQGELLAERGRTGAWWAVADRVSEAVRRVGQCARDGTIDAERDIEIGNRIDGAVRAAFDWVPPRDGAPVCLLVLAPGEQHQLGLSLAELCLREAGWVAQRAEPGADGDRLEKGIERSRASLVAASASPAQTDGAALAAWVERAATAGRARRVRIVLGGSGPWPEEPRATDAVRVRTFDEFRRLLG